MKDLKKTSQAQGVLSFFKTYHGIWTYLSGLSDLEISQDWEQGTTGYTFPDGSTLVDEAGDFSVLE